MSHLTLKASSLVALSLALGATAALAQQGGQPATRQITIEPGTAAIETPSVAVAAAEAPAVAAEAPAVEQVEVAPQAPVISVAPAKPVIVIEKVKVVSKPVIPQPIATTKRYVPSSYSSGYGYGGRGSSYGFGASDQHCQRATH